MSCLSSLSGGPGVSVQPRVLLWPHPSAGFLTILSLTLFVVNCEMLKPRPRISYLVTAYLCWGASALMLWVGEGGASGTRGGARGENPRQGSTRTGDGPPGRSASREGAGPRAGLGVQCLLSPFLPALPPQES